MLRHSVACCCWLAFASIACAQLSAEEGGKAAVDRQRGVGNQQAQPKEQPQAARDEADPFATVTDVDSYITAAQDARRRQVANLYEGREMLRTSEVRVPTRQLRKQIDKINQQIIAWNDPAKPYRPTIKSDEVIALTRGTIAVVSVIDEHNALINGGKSGYWLTGIDTRGWVDDQDAGLDGLIVRRGTRRYATAEGDARTVPEMQFYDLAPFQDRFTRRDDIRTWHTKDGAEHQGALVLYDAGRVTIMDMAGDRADLKLIDLSDADRDYVSQQTPAPKRRAR